MNAFQASPCLNVGTQISGSPTAAAEHNSYRLDERDMKYEHLYTYDFNINMLVSPLGTHVRSIGF